MVRLVQSLVMSSGIKVADALLEEVSTIHLLTTRSYKVPQEIPAERLEDVLSMDGEQLEVWEERLM